MSLSIVSFLVQLDFKFFACRMLSFDINGFNTRFYEHLLSLGSFQSATLMLVIFVNFFLALPYLAVAIQIRVERIPIKKKKKMELHEIKAILANNQNINFQMFLYRNKKEVI